MLLVCSRDRSTTIHPRGGVRVSPPARDVDVSIPISLQRKTPERAITKPSVPRSAVPRIVHGMRVPQEIAWATARVQSITHECDQRGCDTLRGCKPLRVVG